MSPHRPLKSIMNDAEKIVEQKNAGLMFANLQRIRKLKSIVFFKPQQPFTKVHIFIRKSIFLYESPYFYTIFSYIALAYNQILLDM